MKIAHIIRRFVFSEWGGTEQVVWQSAVRQERLGASADIVATSALSVSGSEQVAGIGVYRFNYVYPYWPLNRQTRLTLDKKGGNPYSSGLLRHLADGGYDIMALHCSGRLAQGVIRRCGRCPVVITLHGGASAVPAGEMAQMLAPLKWKVPYGGVWDRVRGMAFDPVSRADAVVCVSREEENGLKRLYPGRRVVYIPNGVDTAHFRMRSGLSIRERYNIPDNRRLLLSVARIDYQKNQKLLVELLSCTDDTHLLLIGPITSGRYYRELLLLGNELGVMDRLTIIPGVPHNDELLPAALQQSDIFILPSLHEPFGISALEAWAAGIPVLASTAGGLKDFIRDGENGLQFDPSSISSLLSAYSRVDREGASLVKRAALDVMDYDWDAVVAKQLALYRSLM